MAKAAHTAPAPVPFTPPTEVSNGTGAPAPIGTQPPMAVMPKAKPKKEIPSTPNKVIGVKVILQYLGEDGQPYEAVTTISPDDYKIQRYFLDVDEKHRVKKDDDGDIEGFEDTGERVLKFQLRYHTRF